MNNRFYTTVEESKHLLELGLSAETADMEWIGEHWCDEETGKIVDGWSPIPVCKIEIEEDDGLTPITLPCWSLEGLLEVMPKDIRIYNDKMNPAVYQTDKREYVCVYVNKNMSGSWKEFFGKDRISASYNMVLNLLKDGYIKKG